MGQGLQQGGVAPDIDVSTPVNAEPARQSAQDLLGNAAVAGMLPDLGPAPHDHSGHDHDGVVHANPEEEESGWSWAGALTGGALGGMLGLPGMIAGGVIGGLFGDDIAEGIGGLFGSEEGQDAAKDPAKTSSGLGDDVDAIMEKSPTLKGNIEALQKQGFTISYGEKGKGTFVDKTKKTIVIDANKQGDPMSVIKSLSHESGHALYETDPYVQFGSLSKDEYVKQNTMRDLKDEGEATIMNCIVREELLAADPKLDIGVSGAQSKQYIELYDKYKGKLDDPKERDKLRGEIGTAFANGEHPSTDPSKTYYDYYSDTYNKHWDKHHPAPAPSGT